MQVLCLQIRRLFIPFLLFTLYLGHWGSDIYIWDVFYSEKYLNDWKCSFFFRFLTIAFEMGFCCNFSVVLNWSSMLSYLEFGCVENLGNKMIAHSDSQKRLICRIKRWRVLPIGIARSLNEWTFTIFLRCRHIHFPWDSYLIPVK